MNRAFTTSLLLFDHCLHEYHLPAHAGPTAAKRLFEKAKSDHVFGQAFEFRQAVSQPTAPPGVFRAGGAALIRLARSSGLQMTGR